MQIRFGWEAANVQSGYGVDLDLPVYQKMHLIGISVSVGLAITLNTNAAFSSFVEGLFYGRVIHNATPTYYNLGTGKQQYIGGQIATSFGAPVINDPSTQSVNNDANPWLGALYSIILKMFAYNMQREYYNGTSGAQYAQTYGKNADSKTYYALLDEYVFPGDHIVLHVDALGNGLTLSPTAGSGDQQIDMETQLVMTAEEVKQ